jgi:hypothetical protein
MLEWSIMPLTRHTISGALSVEPQHIIDHRVFGKFLEVVPEGTKALTPGHFKQGTVAERKEAEEARALAAAEAAERAANAEAKHAEPTTKENK